MGDYRIWIIKLSETEDCIIGNSEGKLVRISLPKLVEYLSKGGFVGMNFTFENGTIKLNNEADIKREAALVKKLNEARKIYEQGHDEIMSNFQYDAGIDELEKLEARTGFVFADSPTRNVGYDVLSALVKEKHTEPMLSLAKTKSVDDLKEFLGSKDGVLSYKMDGLTVVLTFNHGKLQKAVTRGNGVIGEVVTHNAKHFVNVPKIIDFQGEIVVRGEAIITYSTFNKINEYLPPEGRYKNPRNLCSGSVRQLDSQVSANRKIRWYAFRLVSLKCSSAADMDICNSCLVNSEHNDLYDSELRLLKQLGFETVSYRVVNSQNISGAVEQFSNQQTDIPADGLVLAFRDVAYGNKLGATSKSPRHSIAFKWSDDTYETRLIDIEWSPSKTGLINPVAIFEPVEIDGTIVSRASVHNLSILSDLQLGYGDTIAVYKANMIIPQIAENLTRSGTVRIPGTCPVCGHPTEIRTEVSSVQYLYCPNPDCLAKSARMLEHFVSRDAMNIVGLSEATLDKLIDIGVVDGPASIFRLEEHKYEIISTEGFGITSYNKLVNAVNKARKVKLANLIYAMSIPNIGLATAKLICRHFGNDVFKVVRASYYDLTDIDGIGDVVASSFLEWFGDSDNQKMFLDVYREIEIVSESASVGSSMAGITICVTGDVHIFRNRNHLKDIVESLGGKVTGSVSRSTNYLVTNDTTSGSRKNRAAQEYGIPILNEEQFISRFGISL